jgi:anti-sigma B factor antagonist
MFGRRQALPRCRGPNFPHFRLIPRRPKAHPQKGVHMLRGTCRQIGEISVVDFSGKITLGEGSSVLRKMVKDLLQEGRAKIILNLEDVDYIDSSGIGELVVAHSALEAVKGELKLLNLTRRVRDIVQITRLFTVFDIQTDEAAALRSFNN